jgi:hypothetical protein
LVDKTGVTVAKVRLIRIDTFRVLITVVLVCYALVNQAQLRNRMPLEVCRTLALIEALCRWQTLFLFTCITVFFPLTISRLHTLLGSVVPVEAGQTHASIVTVGNFSALLMRIAAARIARSADA